MMDFLELAKKRCSVRSFTEQKVEAEKLAQILEAGRVAPTGANRQPQRVLVIQSEEGLQKLGKAAKIFGAPVALLVCADRSEAWVRPYDNKNISDIDASIITDHMMLEATQLGLGSVWICHFKPDVVRSEFKLPDHLEPVNLLVMGYAKGPVASPDRHSETRKPISETVFYENL